MDSASSCGALRGRGQCVEAARPGGIYTPNQTIFVNDTWKMVGGGQGRCLCSDGWGGSACTEPRSLDHCDKEEFPNPAWKGSDIEAFIERVCNRAKDADDSLTSEQ